MINLSAFTISRTYSIVYGEGMENVLRKVQVNLPFRMMREGFFDLFMEHGLNPEVGMDAVSLESFSDDDFRNIADRFHENGRRITIHGPFIDLSVGSPDPGIKDLTKRRFEQMIRLLPLFKPETVVCHAGYDEKRHVYFRDEWINESVKFWTWAGNEVKKAGGLLVLENVYEKNPDEILMILDRLDPETVGFCLDTGHQSAFGNVSFEEWIGKTGSYIRQIHLHDNRGDRDDHLPLGKGSIDFAPLWDYLQGDNSRNIVITLEPHKEEDLWPSVEYLAGKGLFDNLP